MSSVVSVFGLAAQVAGELFFATEQARAVSLTAKNASAISIRAGQQAVGFKAITGFIDELATTTMHQADDINKLAIALSRQAVRQRRTLDAHDRLLKALERAAGADHVDSVTGALKRNETELNKLRIELDEQFRELAVQLDETLMQLRSAGVIAASSRVEASSAGEFRPQLDSIATSIETASKQITNHLHRARRIIQAVA